MSGGAFPQKNSGDVGSYRSGKGIPEEEKSDTAGPHVSPKVVVIGGSLAPFRVKDTKSLE